MDLLKCSTKRKFCVFLAVILIISCIPLQVYAESCNHSWSDWEILYESTCGEAGEKYRYCTECYDCEYADIPATGNHKWDEWYIENEPSCYQKGSKKRYCDVCNEVQYADIAAYGCHNWGSWVISEDATCACTGLESRECTRCGAYQDRNIPVNPNNHVLSEWMTYEEATALKKGSLYRSCDCGKYEQYKTIPKLKAKVTLNKKSIVINLKKKKTYTLKIKSKTYGDKVKKWTTNNKKVAIVNSKGKITGKKKGTAKITLKMKSGAKVTCKVKVK